MPVDEFSIPAQRLLVVSDLGEVKKGDHVIVVANVIVARDTSVRPGDILPAGGKSHSGLAAFHSREKRGRPVAETAAEFAPKQKTKPRGLNSVNHRRLKVISPERIIEIIRTHKGATPIAAAEISEILQVPIDDHPARSRVTRVLLSLVRQGKLTQHRHPSRANLRTYEVPASDWDVAHG